MRSALVLGLGLSGKAVVPLLIAQGDRVFGYDDQIPLDQLEREKFEGMELLSNQQDVPWAEIDLLVPSPGISPRHPCYQKARSLGIEIKGEAELALRRLDQPAVAITGTNGKTTVTLLVAHILREAGIKAKALGNVGEPLSTYLINPEKESVAVVELSSFQLETLSTPAFDAAALLNITPDHLDRYATLEDYARTKCHLQSLLKPMASFFVSQPVVDQFSSFLQPGYQVYSAEKIEEILPVDYRSWGAHDVDNAMAAWALCKPFEVTAESFRRALCSFQKPKHRIEFVRSIQGVHFFDDSKGTNIDAVMKAVEAMKGPVILIVGGVDKGASYFPWKEAFRGKVKRIIGIGQAAPKIFRELNTDFEMEIVDSLSSAVENSMAYADEGDHVLLSPGCSSYDMFRDYAHRGEEFQRSVFSLREGG
jgi:UDP-N-acetylmuramoylalanine--D-glutamate ligase